MNLDISTIETLEMLCEAFGERYVSRAADFERHSRFNVGRVSVEDDRSGGDQEPAKRQKMLKKLHNLSKKTVAEQSMS
jgi:hypothetical protein